ncbi:hypothetical protein AeMF1_015488 [Aphanomyces euteiches]|nr:hypothetical protein AeMF1_015488 [Aphanomyces euteiches]
MQHRGNMFGETKKAKPLFLHHQLDVDQVEHLLTLSQRTFQDCLKTVQLIEKDEASVVKHSTRPNATLHHERTQIKASLERTASAFLRRMVVDDGYAALMGFSESKLLCNLSPLDDPSQLHVGLRWAGLPSVLSLISDRDFCGIERGDFLRDLSGRHGWAYSFVSMELPSCPSQPDYVRGWLRLAHICLETSEPGVIDVISFVHADFKGTTPQFVARQVTRSMLKDTHKVLLQSTSPPRRSSTSNLSIDSNRTWLKTQTASVASCPGEESFHRVASALVDPQNYQKRWHPTSTLPPRDSAECAPCHKHTNQPMICQVCDKISCAHCSIKWCIVYKYDLRMYLCLRCHDGLIMHQGRRCP